VLRIRGDSEAAGVVAVFGRMAGYVLVVFGVDPAERSDGPLDLPAVSVLEGPDGVVAVADSGQREWSRTRRCQGRFSPEPGASRVRLPSASPACCDRPPTERFTSVRVNQRRVAHVAKTCRFSSGRSYFAKAAFRGSPAAVRPVDQVAFDLGS
jgi:hypothetical protein